ncbi:extracellular solute-binding protein [Kitasatospora saccharophila]|uniref:Extracellular solute-binding protein n=1 Tax=Kitasatospora saccharophila TaxID=407973 RepID=A0ABN2WEX2_9ACTN
MGSNRIRRASAVALAAATAFAATACGSGGSGSGDAGGVVTISVNGLPPATQTVDRKNFEDDVKAFEASHPNIRIDAHEGLMDPKTFAAKLAGGQLEDVYYVYFTDPAGLIQRHQAADITPYLKDVPGLADIKPALQDVFKGRDGKVYGLPTGNYSMGLVYNRELFTKAGLDPDKPPTSWDEVRTAAQKITALGDGTVGYADFSKNNQGGWHLTSWIYSLGGEVATRDDSGKWKAAVDSDAAHQALQHLHDMRWTDDSMGSRQLLEIPDVQKMMGAGKLGMYLAGPDNIPTIVKQFERKYDEYGLAAMPGTATLGGGDGFMFNPKDTPAKIKAGLAWVQWKYLSPEHEETATKKSAGSDIPIGLPQPDLLDGKSGEAVKAIHAQYANVPQQNYRPFVDRSADVKVKVEPPNAQQIYTVLDGVMQAVLTKQDADLDGLLKDAQKKVDSILATAQ